MNRAPGWKMYKKTEQDAEVVERREELAKEKIERIKEGKKSDHIVNRDLNVPNSFYLLKDSKRGAFKYHKVILI